jgi:hypothetical protein
MISLTMRRWAMTSKSVARAKAALALDRLRARAATPARTFERARHVEAPSDLECAWLAAELAPDEELLAWIPSTSKLPVQTDGAAGTEAAVHFLFTSRRAALVAIAPSGDARVDGLDPIALQFERRRGRVTVRSGEHRWAVTKKVASLLAEVERGPTLAEIDRLVEVARLNFIERAGAASERRAKRVGEANGGAGGTEASPTTERVEGPEGRRSRPERDGKEAPLDFAHRILDLSVRRGSVAAEIARRLVAAELDEPRADLDALLAKLRESNAAPRAFAELWLGWRISRRAALALLAELRAQGDRAEPWALELHRSVHARDRERRAPFDAARADIALAEHLIDVARRAEAAELLEARLGALPSEALEDLLPREDADLTAGGGGQALRIRVYELLAVARAEAGAPDLRAVSELARLEPLVVDRVRALSERGSGDVGERASRVLGVLQPHGLGRRDDPVLRDATELEPFSGEFLQTVIRHPLVREGSALLGRLQAMLAAVPAPDPTVIRQYCERLSSDRAAAPEAVHSAARALDVAVRALGVPRVEAYVSRGEKGVGVRAYEADPPFVLIGGRHLEADSAFYLSPLELGFAIGAEVTHLRFGHTRATSSEVWAGALDKSRQGLDIALGVLPLLRGFSLADRAADLVTRVPIASVKRAIDRATLANKRARARETASSTEPISAVNEQLVAAHRLMQLTADRAGLVIAGDLHAALRAMLLVRKDYERELDAIEERGLDAVLAERTEGGRMRYQHLAVRVAALLSFYLSPDSTRLGALASA